MYTRVFGTAKTVLYIEVSLFQSVLIEGFHCIPVPRVNIVHVCHILSCKPKGGGGGGGGGGGE